MANEQPAGMETNPPFQSKAPDMPNLFSFYEDEVGSAPTFESQNDVNSKTELEEPGSSTAIKEDQPDTAESKIPVVERIFNDEVKKDDGGKDTVTKPEALPQTSTKTRSTKPRKTKQQRDIESTLSILVPEEDTVLDERAEGFAQAYFNKLKDRLEEPENATYIEFLTTMNEFGVSIMTVAELYERVMMILAKHEDLCGEFLAFLLPEHAMQCGKFMEYLVITKMKDFFRKMETCFSKHPMQLRKIYSSLATLSGQPNVTVEDVRLAVTPLLKGNTFLLDSFLELLPQERPPESLMTDFEEMDCDDFNSEVSGEGYYETMEIPETEDQFGGENCSCTCHNSDDEKLRLRALHCIPCGTKFIHGKVFVQTGRVLRPATVKFEDEEKEASIKRLVPNRLPRGGFRKRRDECVFIGAPVKTPSPKSRISKVKTPKARDSVPKSLPAGETKVATKPAIVKQKSPPQMILSIPNPANTTSPLTRSRNALLNSSTPPAVPAVPAVDTSPIIIRVVYDNSLEGGVCILPPDPALIQSKLAHLGSMCLLQEQVPDIAGHSKPVENVNTLEVASSHDNCNTSPIKMETCDELSNTVSEQLMQDSSEPYERERLPVEMMDTKDTLPGDLDMCERRDEPPMEQAGSIPSPSVNLPLDLRSLTTLPGELAWTTNKESLPREDKNEHRPAGNVTDEASAEGQDKSQTMLHSSQEVDDSGCSVSGSEEAEVESSRSASGTPTESWSPLPWTRHEDRVILERLQREGSLEETFLNISRELSSRTLEEIRQRFQNLVALLQQMTENEILKE